MKLLNAVLPGGRVNVLDQPVGVLSIVFKATESWDLSYINSRFVPYLAGANILASLFWKNIGEINSRYQIEPFFRGMYMIKRYK